MTEFKTANVDLAAALLAHDQPLDRVETPDGLTCEFVFADTGVVTGLAAAWAAERLEVNAKRLSVANRRLRYLIRKTQGEYAVREPSEK